MVSVMNCVRGLVVTMSKPKVLVLMAAFNGEMWIKEQIDSITRQAGVNVSLYIFDDGSDDSTVAVIEECVAKNNSISLIRATTPSGSAGKAFMQLMTLAPSSGFDFVAFADQDDIWDADKISTAAKQLLECGGHAYSCAVTAVWSNGRIRVIRQGAPARTLDHFFEGGGQGCTYLIENKFFCEIQEFIKNNRPLCKKFHYHDWLIYILARAWCKVWIFDDTPHIRYRQHDANELGARGSMGGLQRRLERIKSGWYTSQIRVAANIYGAARGAIDVQSDKVEKFLRGGSWFYSLRILFFQSRRRLIDRCALVILFLAGWI